MRQAPEAFRQFFCDVPGAAEAIREETSSAMDTFLKSTEFRQLQEQSREAWRGLGVDPELPFLARHRMLCANAGLSWTEGESLADEPPCDFMPILRKRAQANAAAQPQPIAGVPIATESGAAWSEARPLNSWLKIFDRSERWLRDMRTRFPSEFAGNTSRLKVSIRFLRERGIDLE